MHRLIIIASDNDQGRLIGSYFIKYGYSDELENVIVVQSIKELDKVLDRLAVKDNDDIVLIYNDYFKLSGKEVVHFHSSLYHHFSNGKSSLIYISPFEEEDYLHQMCGYEWCSLEDGYVQLECVDNENEHTDVMKMMVIYMNILFLESKKLYPDCPLPSAMKKLSIHSSYHPKHDGYNYVLSDIIPVKGKKALMAIPPGSPLPPTPDQSDDDSEDSSFVEDGEVSE